MRHGFQTTGRVCLDSTTGLEILGFGQTGTRDVKRIFWNAYLATCLPLLSTVAYSSRALLSFYPSESSLLHGRLGAVDCRCSAASLSGPYELDARLPSSRLIGTFCKGSLLTDRKLTLQWLSPVK